MLSNKKLSINIILSLISISIPLFIGDRILKSLRLPKDSSRLMLLAGSKLYSSKDGYRRYHPSEGIEQLAIYDKEIAYQYKYKSNNLGLISHPNILKNDSIDLIINGDSYTEGQGGYPWVVQWQKNELNAKDIKSLNYAIAGNGFGDFKNSSINAKIKFKAKKNLIFFIEHDAYRPYQKMNANNWCSFYSNGILDNLLGPLTCKTYGIVWHHIGTNMNQEEILEKSKYLQQYGIIPSLIKASKALNKPQKKKLTKPNSEVPESLKLHNNLKEEKLRFGTIPLEAIDSIKTINELYGKENVLYIQLPERPGGPDQLNINFTKALKKAGVHQIINLWQSCQLSEANFGNLDPHPNSSGYKKIKECIVSNEKIEHFLDGI